MRGSSLRRLGQVNSRQPNKNSANITNEFRESKLFSLEKAGTFEIQVLLEKLATRYSQPAARNCYINIRSEIAIVARRGATESPQIAEVCIVRPEPLMFGHAVALM